MSEETKELARSSTSDAPAPKSSSATEGGFFSIYKPGQGYWTRLCTTLAAAGLLLLVSRWLYIEVQIRLASALTSPGLRTAEMAGTLSKKITLAVCAALVLTGAVIIWRFINAPKGAEFLITTDSEMKKVNWASRKELFGSTRVVIIFLIFITLFLFLSDIVFGWFFHVIGVLKTGPFAS